MLRGFNPWWQSARRQVPEFRRIGFDRCWGLLQSEELKRGILVSGPRRVGKTTVLLQLAEALLAQGHPASSIVYLSLDHPILKLVGLDDALRIYRERQHPEGEKAFLLVDEVPYLPDWELHLKQIIDHHPEYRVVATGSASAVQAGGISESGVGRWVSVSMPTLSFYEYVQLSKEQPAATMELRPSELFDASAGDLSTIAAQLRSLMPSFLQYLLRGGFPETTQLSDAGLAQRLVREDVVDRVLKRDMTALFGVRNVLDLERLFVYLCLHVGSQVAVKTCANSLHCSVPTVSSYLGFLEQANLVYRLPPIAIGGKKILKARHKYYLVDAALRNAVLMRGEEVLDDPNELGPMVETAVLRQLMAYHYRDTPQIGYWRSPRTQREVDIVVRSPRYHIAVEVKYRENARLTSREGLASYCETEDVTQAYWITRREEDFDVRRIPGSDTRVLRIPAHIFCYLLGLAERRLWYVAQ